MVAVVGFLLLWIPLVAIVGYLLVLVAFIMVYGGRDLFGPSYRRFVTLAANLLMVTIIVGIALAFVAVWLLFVAHWSYASAIFVDDLVVALLGTLAATALVYDLADLTTRKLLFAGVAAALATTTIAAWVPAVAHLTLPLGAHISTGASGVVNVVPDAIFAVAYLRARSAFLRRLAPQAA